jgi:hypothetical protein
MDRAGRQAGVSPFEIHTSFGRRRARRGLRATGALIALVAVVLGLAAIAGAAKQPAASSPSSPASPEKLDPDQAAKVSTDVNTSLLVVNSGTYQLSVQNQSGVGSINTFAWVPGPGWHVTSVVRTSGGKCTVNSGALACSGKIAPPKNCTCQPGGQMTIVFRMTGPKPPPPSKAKGTVSIGTTGGYFLVKTVTLTKRHIPTALPTPNT